ncbi:A/G-specific adenine glycosylase [Patiriisocius marinistellae]|uniref:Adenine DNA glycosylase n=1 Tax=Patiriisocius marinistellae TaxID=2494560 RepID=A0A5J4FX64_9FLAO|nr:A/G-specific adenine glycosylase [Patiriisocius marinistellae]
MEQGTPYYFKFIEAFPNVQALANAPQEQVLKLWQGLGYYSRARNLHITAQHITGEFKGEFPKTYKELLSLKGVGDYTASAIGSICFDLPTAVVDGNVYRILSRIYGISTPINSSAGIKEFKQLAQKLLDISQSGTFNQATMEFGARYCVPQNPDCLHCIFNKDCVAFLSNTVGELPVKIKKQKIKKRYFNYIVIVSADKKTILNQRTGKGIWQQLYEFPLVESASEISENQLINTDDYVSLSKIHGITELVLYNDVQVVHKLSHQHLYTKFWIGYSNNLNNNGIKISEVQDFAVPVLVSNFISSFPEFK